MFSINQIQRPGSPAEPTRRSPTLHTVVVDADDGPTTPAPVSTTAAISPAVDGTPPSDAEYTTKSVHRRGIPATLPDEINTNSADPMPAGQTLIVKHPGLPPSAHSTRSAAAEVVQVSKEHFHG